MDTASSPVSRSAHVTRAAMVLLALLIVGLSLLVVLGPSPDAVLRPAPPDPLLGPFRWSTLRALA